MCSSDLHINKDAVSQPVDEKLITEGTGNIYSNENVSYNNISDEKEKDVISNFNSISNEFKKIDRGFNLEDFI